MAVFVSQDLCSKQDARGLDHGVVVGLGDVCVGRGIVLPDSRFECAARLSIASAVAVSFAGSCVQVSAEVVLDVLGSFGVDSACQVAVLKVGVGSKHIISPDQQGE